MVDGKTRLSLLFVMAVGVVSLAPITAGPVSALPPDDGLVAYVASASESHPDGRIAVLDSRGNIFLMEDDGTGLVQLTDPWNFGGTVILWSPDGLRLAFTSDGYIEQGDGGMYVTNLDGDARRVTSEDVGGIPSSWSPDGTKILFVSGSDRGIYTVDVATGTVASIASLEPQSGEIDANFESPMFSPDGSSIAYVERTTSYVSGGDLPWSKPLTVRSGAVFVADVDGSNPVRITSSLAQPGGPAKYVDDDHAPVWSPDGTSIAYASGVPGDPVSSVLVVVDPDGSDRRELTNGSDKVLFPAWSPDGRHIAWSGDSDSYVIDVDGSNQVDIGYGGPPSWSSDSSRIALYTADSVAIVRRDGSEYTLLDPAGLPEGSWVSQHGWQPVFPPVGLVDPGQGRWYLKGWQGEMSSFYYGNPGDVPFMGDWDCDGVDTPGLYRQSDGYAYLRNSNTQGVADVKFYFGNPGDIPLAGDWDGDGCDTLSIYRPSEQVFYIVNELGSQDTGLGAADYSFMFGNPGDKPVVGDWDGDGIDEIGLHREATGLFYWRNTLDTGVADGSIYFGDPGDLFVSGEWGTIPGRDTPGVYRPSNGFVYFRYSLTEGNADTWFPWPDGADSFIPVAGNFGLG